jgi:hypothetical protein
VNGSERVIFIPHCTKTWQIISIQNIKSRGWQKLYAKFQSLKRYFSPNSKFYWRAQSLD